jgi:hypothetical protein
LQEVIAREAQAEAAQNRRAEDDVEFHHWKNRNVQLLRGGLVREFTDADRPSLFAAAKSDPAPLQRKTRGGPRVPVQVGLGSLTRELEE